MTGDFLKKIIFYISDHGKGHATRSIAIIRELEKLNIEIIIRNSNSIDFIQKSLPDVKLISGITDVGTTIKKDGVSIDLEDTISNVSSWINNMSNNVDKELEQFLKYEPDLIISDISTMPFHVAQKLKIPSIAISNFTWSDIIKEMPSKQLSFLDESYSLADLAIQLPFCTPMKQFPKNKKVGIISRQSTLNKQDFKNHFKIRPSEKCIFLSLGNSKNKINCKIDSNIKILTNGVTLKNTFNELQVSDYTEQQNLVLGADLVICKCGYGLISECITMGTPFVYVYDSNHFEQMVIVKELQHRNIGMGISVNDLDELDLSVDFLSSLKKFNKEPIDTMHAIQYIQEFL